MSKRYLLILTVLIALLSCTSVVLCADDPQAAAPKIPVKDFSKATAYTVERIVDGDTVVVKIDGKNMKVRLVGVDTPETVHPNKPVERYGKKASEFLSNLLKGEKIYIEWKEDEKTDKYGRALLYLWRAPDGLFVNLEIVRQGYGHAYTRFPFEHTELFRYYERQAREAKRGLWAPAVAKKVARPAAPKQAEVNVYAAGRGKRYHYESCRYVRKRADRVKLTIPQAKARGLTPCKVCEPPE